MKYENIRFEHRTPEIARITIDRPTKMNSLNRATLMELSACIEAVPRDVTVLIITGAGEKAFIAGADISEMSGFSIIEAKQFSGLGHAVMEKLEKLEAVVIAEVNGYALGGGCELMMACDFAIASEKAKIGQPEVTLGVTPGFGGTTRLPRRVPTARARQILYTGEAISAQEAKAVGLVNEVLPPGELRARVDAIADRIAKNGAIAVALTKRSVRLAIETDLSTANAFEQETFALAFATDDLREGMKAFLEKRAPDWRRK